MLLLLNMSYDPSRKTLNISILQACFTQFYLMIGIFST